MDQPLSKINFGDQSGFYTGAGKGDVERPINRRLFRENLSKIKKLGVRGKIASQNGIKTTYTYK
jgi:hypothetical protein